MAWLEPLQSQLTHPSRLNSLYVSSPLIPCQTGALQLGYSRSIVKMPWEEVSTEYMYVHTSWKRHYEGAGSSCSPPSVNFTTAHDATFGNAVILILLRFGVEKFGTVFHGPGDFGLSPNTSVFGVLALEADGAIDGASMPRVLESPRS